MQNVLSVNTLTLSVTLRRAHDAAVQTLLVVVRLRCEAEQGRITGPSR